MSSFTTVEVDFDVYKLIETERRSFDEPRNDALRRLLKLPAAVPAPPRATNGGSPSERAWSGVGVTLKHGTKLRMSYNGRLHEGEIVDGKWVIEGRAFDSPSGAASGVALTKRGEHPSLNGWVYWEALAPGSEKWVRIATLHPAYSLTPFRRLRGAE